MRYAGICLIIVSVLCCNKYLFSADTVQDKDKKIQEIAESILDNILIGLKTNNYNRCLKDFDLPTDEKTLFQRHFKELDQKIEKSMGNYQSRQYLGLLNKNNCVLIFWKARFSSTKEDILIKLSLVYKNEKYFVDKLWFQ
jgi:hypothetical protein